jgi:hypothetical protein
MRLGVEHSEHIREKLTESLALVISHATQMGVSKAWQHRPEARKRGLSGVHLKEEAEALPQAVSASGKNFLIGTD